MLHRKVPAISIIYFSKIIGDKDEADCQAMLMETMHRITALCYA